MESYNCNLILAFRCLQHNKMAKAVQYIFDMADFLLGLGYGY